MWLQENFTNVLREGIGKLVNNKDLGIRFTILKNGEGESVSTATIPLPEKKQIVKSYPPVNRIPKVRGFCNWS